MGSPLRIVTTGLAVTYPFGGVFWDYLQYPLGFQRLGHEVLYLEDTGKWCYDPASASFVEDSTGNVERFARNVADLDAKSGSELAKRWCYRYPDGRTAGWSWPEVVRFCRGADLLLNVSASCWVREEHRAAARVAFLDSDPLYTQASLLQGDAGDPRTTQGDAGEGVRLARWRETHDVFFTFGENVGSPDCTVPTCGLPWVRTRQPVLLDLFAGSTVPVEARRPVFTTVASWEPAKKGPVVNGVEYAGKSREFGRFLDLPSKSPLPIEIALSGEAPTELLRQHGWQLRDGHDVSHDPWVYRDYLANSTGEWSVAKNAYVASNCGWFSCRTACYLALGVPAVVQDTGFGRSIPTGAGLLSFSSLEEASDCLARVAREPARHAAAARAIAEEYFDSDVVLSNLLGQALA
jgi:hypothetical protein